jgi:thiol-disulfide isomerase/thioredoxin
MHRLIPAAVVLILCSPAFAQETENAENASLKALATHFENLDQFSVNVTVDVDININGRKQESNAAIQLAVRKPNQFRLSFSTNGNEGLAVNDGENTTTYIGEFKQYKTDPTDPEAPLDHEMMGVLLNGALVADDPYKVMTDGAQSITSAGEGKVGETACDIVRMRTNEGVVDVYISQGDKPLPLQVIVDQTPMLKAAGRQGSIKIVMSYNDWKAGEKLDDTLFAFDAPEDAKKVTKFGPPAPGDALLGKKAPAVELTSLKGEKFTLDDVKGKIVVLDFWATWCGPCIRALPVIREVTSDMAEQDVVLYTVNQRESDDKVNAFLQKKEWTDMNVLMDRKAAVAKEYKVRGIPQTVIIGKDGTVQAVHVGFSPQIGDKLRKELETLAKGESLVE